MEKSIDVFGIWTKGLQEVGADGSTGLWFGQSILIYFVRGSIQSITVRLTSCLTGLDLNKQVIMFKFNISNAAKMQTNLTWRTPHSDTSPYTLSEYSLVWQFPHFTLWLFLIENTSMIRYIFLDLCTQNRAGVKICLKMFAKKILVFFFFLNCTIFIYMSHLQFMYTWDHSRDS